ncbi:MAG: beta-ketoacyl-ACP synthase 3, partial [Proteobacteria bacterium]|nr:beta-ketoacyl-ACP synthase 3 [Pseudomonadota bacterium]
MVVRSVVTGCGAHLPRRVVTNDELARSVDTSDEWIYERTGIRERRIAAEDEKTSVLGAAAAEAALQSAGEAAENIDLIVLATTTPDETFPATATQVQALIGATKAVAFDVQAVCSGFIFSLAVADSFIQTGRAETALVIGAETFSRIVDWQDRDTCVLFGDGAGAVVLRAKKTNGDARALVNLIALHENYEPIVGTWVANWKLLDGDGKVTSEIKGSATNEWIVGGRWVQSTFTTDLVMNEEKFHGVGLFGHDNTTGEYHN